MVNKTRRYPCLACFPAFFTFTVYMQVIQTDLLGIDMIKPLQSILFLHFRRQVLKTLDAKPADACQRQRWSLNNDGFISLKGTSLVLGLADSSNEVHFRVIKVDTYRGSC